MGSVVDFENERVIRKRYRRANLFDEDIFGLNVCLKRTEIEEIILDRSGGFDLLYSKERFMTLLGRGVRHVVVTDDDTKVLYVVKYDEEELEQIQRIIEYTSMDVSILPTYEVTEAIRRSFAADERDPLPPREQCYLAESSFNALKDLGLPIEEADFLNEDESCSGYKNPYFRCGWRFW